MLKKFTLLFISICFALLSTHAQKKGSVVTIVQPNGPDNLNPYNNFSSTGAYIMEYLYFSLLRPDKDNLRFQPLISAGMPDISPDELVYTYKLDEDAKWNTNDDITAADVEFSIKMIRNPFVQMQHKRVHYENISNVIVKGEREIEFHLKKASPQSLRITGDFPILSKEFFDPDGKLDNISFEMISNPSTINEQDKIVLKEIAEKVNAFGMSLNTYNSDAVSGPYLIENWERGKKIVLTYNKKFWGRKKKEPKNNFFLQNLETIVFQITPDESQVRSQIFDNKVNCVTSITAPLFFELSEIPTLAPNYQFETPEGASYQYIGLNMAAEDQTRPPYFTDLKVRQAFAHLIDVDYLLESSQYGYGERIASDTHFLSKEFRNDNLKLISFDVEKAKALLDEAGWKDTDGDGIRDKMVDGEKLQLRPTVVYNENNPQRKQIAESFASTAKKAGVEIIAIPLSYPQYLQTLTDHNFDMIIGAWVSDPNEESYKQLWHTSSAKKGGSNVVGFGNSETDALIESFDDETDLQKRMEIAKKIQKAIYDQQPYIFLWAPTERLIISKGFKNVNIYSARPGFWAAEWEPVD